MPADAMRNPGVSDLYYEQFFKQIRAL